MREKVVTLLGILITWLAIFLIVPLTGFDIKIWVLLASASIWSLFAGCLVMLGETVIENIILVVILLVLTGILSGSKPNLGFIFISALLSGVIGAMTNQINQYAAHKVLQSDASEPCRRTQR